MHTSNSVFFFMSVCVLFECVFVGAFISSSVEAKSMYIAADEAVLKKEKEEKNKISSEENDSDKDRRKEKRQKIDKTGGKKKWYVLGAGYGFVTDLQEKEYPHVINHSISLSAGAKIDAKSAVYGKTSAGYYTVGRGIPIERNFEFKEILIGIDRKFELDFLKPGVHSLAAGMDYTVLLGDGAEYEGYLGMPSAGIRVQSIFIEKIKISNAFSAGFLINKYDYSPSTGISNPESWLKYMIGAGYRIYKTLFFNAGFGVKRSRRIDGLVTVAFGNELGLSFSYKNFLAGLFLVNGSYFDATGIDLWYIDRYRRMIKFGVGYEF